MLEAVYNYYELWDNLHPPDASNNVMPKALLRWVLLYFTLWDSFLLLHLYLYLYLAFSLSGEGHCYRFPQLQQALLYRFVVEEVTVHNTGIREPTIRQGLAPRRQTWQRVDWIDYFVFRANFDRYERAHTVRTSLAGTSRPRTNCCC